MKYLLLLLFISLLLLSTCMGQLSKISMAGLCINDDEKILKDIKLPIVVSDVNMITYETVNKNELYVSLESGKIVSMENRQSDRNQFTKTLLFDNFVFRKTTLKEISDEFGSYGYKYKDSPFLNLGGTIYNFNCYEFETNSDVILIISTIVNPGKLHIDVLDENNSNKLTLYVVVLADKAKLEESWGKEKVFDKNYKKIKL